MRQVPLVDGTRADVGTVYCIGRNYAAHAAELGNAVPEQPVVFLKSATALRGLDATPVAFPDATFHHEVEIVLLIGSEVPLGGRGTWAAVRALGLGLDVTRRDVQTRCKADGLPWTPAKSFAGSAVVAPMVPLAALGEPAEVRFSLDVDGERRQEGDPGRMIFDVPTILTYLASLAPLVPGDLVFTGTPEGVGPLSVGASFAMTLRAPTGTWTFEGIY